MFQLIPKVMDGVHVRTRRLVESTTNSEKPFIYVPHLVHGGIVILETGKGHLLTFATEEEVEYSSVKY